MLYDYQQTAVTYAQRHKWVLIGDEQGLGKTLEAIMSVKDITGIKVIVCPSMLKLTWKREIEKWVPEATIEVVLTGKHNYPIHDMGDIWFIISYDMLKHFPKLPQAVIMDESHYIKNLGAKRTKVCHDFCFKHLPEMVILLSGTPIKNSVIEFYSPLKLLSYCPTKSNGDRVEEKSQYAFNVRFSNSSTRIIYAHGRQIEIKEFKGVRNVDKLKQYLRGKYIRRLSENVLDLPEIIDKEIMVSEGEGSTKLWDAYKSHETGEKSVHFSALKIESALSKVNHTTQMALSLLEQGEPCVIFTDHIAPLEQMMGLLYKKCRVEDIQGSTTTLARDKKVQDFQAGKLDILVCTIGAASTGYTLHRARTLIFNDCSWGYTDQLQARKRIHRIGQKHSCVINYILNGKVDLRIKRRIAEKETNLKEVL
jgi:SWI/SNF-related matrix-associated actin-dependent regulator 1 of chromatin subfamily A